MKKRREIVTLAIGVFAALVILAGQINYYAVQVKALEDISLETQASEQGDKGQDELPIFTNDAVSSVVTFSFHQVLHFITNVYSETVELTWEYVEDHFISTEFFETLFQRIISPNAP